MYSRSEKINHDRGRSTLRERARKHFFEEKKEMEHELRQNKAFVTHLVREGYCLEKVEQTEHRYEVSFVNPQTSEHKACNFQFENNFHTLESIWKTNGHTK